MKQLIIFELANNHMGDVDHGKAIIASLAPIAEKYNSIFDFAIKFQFRNLATFIHKNYHDRIDIKYVKRFQETELDRNGFSILKVCAEKCGFITGCTAFDETSVDLVASMQFNFIKIASCSLTDWPLLNKIANVNLPIIASTAGSTFDQIDQVVSFLMHRNKDITLMHCIGEYPTATQKLQLNQIGLLKRRFPYLRVGFSTHEDPSNVLSIIAALSQGAQVFEKHVDLKTDVYSPNLYSATPDQIDAWLFNAKTAIEMLGSETDRYKPSQQELNDLYKFRRGVFAAKDLLAGEIINQFNTYYAWPAISGQAVANDMSKYVTFTAPFDVKTGDCIMTSFPHVNSREIVWQIVQKVKSVLTDSKAVFPGEAKLEISYHYGLDNFYQIGSTMITIINRNYCKKLIVLLPNQQHPEQYHKRKEETFIVLYGDISLIIDGKQKHLSKGDVVTIQPMQRHAFSTIIGCVIEEISSTHYTNDSFYTDNKINDNHNRKTIVDYWLA